MSRRNRKPIASTPQPARIDSLSPDGRGVARVEGKAVFVDGALPGEEVLFTYLKKHRHFDEGKVTEVLRPSAERVAPRCSHFAVCGGCSLQHLATAAQTRAKERALIEQLQRIGQVTPEAMFPALTGPAWGYRRKARLGVRFVEKKGALLVGFRERRSSYVAELDHCDVLHPAVGTRILALRDLVAGLQAYRHIAQIEVAVGDEAAALVFRHLQPLIPEDLEALRAFARGTGLQVWLQPGGVETAAPLWPEGAQLSYRLPAHGLEFHFLPSDFTQVNAEVNLAMVDRALEALDPQPGERVLDLFCGLGNFSLPLARRAAKVIGVEGHPALVARAQANAAHNGIDNVEYFSADLNQPAAAQPWAAQSYAKLLLDPPRTGAAAIAAQLHRFAARRVVYISCNPATLARDAQLILASGYRLSRAGILDMFPHTNHVESIAVFDAVV